MCRQTSVSTWYRIFYKVLTTVRTRYDCSDLLSTSTTVRTTVTSEKAYRPSVPGTRYSSTNGQTTEQIRSIPKQQRMPKMAFLVATTVPMNTSSTIETHQPTNQPQTELATNYLD